MLTSKDKEMQTALDEYYANKNVDTLHTLLVRACADQEVKRIPKNIQVLICELFHDGDAPILLNTIDVLPMYVAKIVLSQLVRIIIEKDIKINFEWLKSSTNN